MKKEILNEINEILKTKEFLEREDVKEISKKFNIINGILIKQIQELGIPCMAANLKLSLHGFGIPVEENLCSLEKFNKLGDWRLIIFKNSKINVSYNCKICNAPGKSRLAHIIQRKFFKSEPICSKCIEREVSKTNEWKNTNSIAQLIAQNKPEQVEKNKQAQIERFKNPEARIKASEASKKNWENSEYREKLVKIAQDKWKNPEYAKNVIEKSRNSQKCGMYKEVYYNSSYELAFLLKIEEERGDLNCIKRPDFYISYKKTNNKPGCYYPDFILDDNFLIEVKGYAPWIDLENLLRKNRAAKLWCKSKNLKFRVVELKDFGYFWLRKSLQKHKELLNGKT